MGNKINKKLILLSLLFLFTSFFVYREKEAGPIYEKSIKQYFKSFGGYKISRAVELEDSAFNMLKLDDYLYADFVGPDGKLNLYIGYYYTADKSSAPHSPLVCYPSQGWRIEGKPSGFSLNVDTSLINYDEIITSSGDKKELVLFWFQAYHHTTTQIAKNKIEIGYNKFMGNSEQHAFVRISVPLNGADRDQAKESALNFINAFYPQFIQFIDED